jgi:hypothetical protein
VNFVQNINTQKVPNLKAATNPAAGRFMGLLHPTLPYISPFTIPPPSQHFLSNAFFFVVSPILFISALAKEKLERVFLNYT